ncbi:MAG: type II secretion system F family protein [Dehalococcoidales bacterium]
MEDKITYQYVARNSKGALVKGKLSAASDSAAAEMLSYTGYETVSIKQIVPFFSMDKLRDNLFVIKPAVIILFYRQLALMLESGTNIISSLELLQKQIDSRTFKKVLGEIVVDVRGGNQLSTALAKYPKIFSQVYCQLISVGEQSGDLDVLLNQVADYMEREIATVKATKSALMMPGITAGISVLVIGLLVVYILPSFAGMYEALGAELPPVAMLLIAFGEAVKSNILYILMGIAVISGMIIFYIKTPGGRYQLDKLLLNIPRLGRVRLLGELARYCRSMSLLFRAGMPLTDVVPMLIRGSNNMLLAGALADVQEAMLKGEGLSRPMGKNKYFLPMMVQLIEVGEETGNLESTLMTIARSYEAEAEDKIRSLIALIPPTLTLVIGGLVGLIAVTLISAMSSMYGDF